MSASALSAAEIQSHKPGLLRQQRPNDVSRQNSKMVAQRRLSFVKEHARETTVIQSSQNDRTFREKSSAALKRRLFPNSNLTTKQLAYALRISEPTIWNLLSGNNDPSGRVFFKMVEFFGAQFLHEVFGGPKIHVIDPRASRRTETIQRIAELQRELEAMG